jgi:hypothetical protein
VLYWILYTNIGGAEWAKPLKIHNNFEHFVQISISFVGGTVPTFTRTFVVFMLVLDSGK